VQSKQIVNRPWAWTGKIGKQKGNGKMDKQMACLYYKRLYIAKATQ